MSETSPGPRLPEANTRSRVRHGPAISPIWLIPLVAIAIAGWLTWHTLSQKGPVITITFLSAEGLEAGKSHVKHKEVDLGLVQSIVLSPDLSRVIVTVQMNREAAAVLNEGARFWVVRPRLFAGNISGLSTLVSGSYIELLPKTDGGAAKRDFTGLEEPPVLETDVAGTTFLVEADKLGSISLGAPVFYRDLTVGTVLGWDLKEMARRVTIHVFVKAPFDQYVKDRSHFWDASGVSLKMGADGIQLQLESLRAVLLGGIAFDTPEEAAGAPASKADTSFRLFASHDAAVTAGYARRFTVMTYFKDSVRGLTVGAPVELQGLRIGEVTGIDLVYDPVTNAVSVPVTFSIEPDRMNRRGMPARTDLVGTLRELVARGLRVKLDSANLVTGQQLVALEFMTEPEPAELRVENGVPVLPSASGGFTSMTQSAAAILRKVNALPFEQIGNNLNTALHGASDLTNSPELKQAMQSLSAALAEVREAVQHLDNGLDPAVRRLPDIAKSLQDAIGRISRLVGSVDTGYGDTSKFHRDLDRMLEQLNDTARSVRVLADLLSRNPEALIRGRASETRP